MLRALIAEDSTTVRELLVGILESDPEIMIVGTVKNGLEAVEATGRLRPDVVIMDINMPVMDGLEATRRIMIETPVPIVIVSATVDVRDVAVSMNALQTGALAVLAKPPGVGAPGFAAAVGQLLSTVKAMARVKVVRHWPAMPAPVPPPPSGGAPHPRGVRVIAVAASTGGPAALARILSHLPADFPVPILVVQHIAAGFVCGLAAWLDSVCAPRICVARDGERLAPATVYLAGDDAHLTVAPGSRIVLDKAPPVAGFRPSATSLFASVADVFGATAVGVVLTGMGRDGVDGLRLLRVAGGRIVAQDEKSSIVFGMPGAAVAAGLADEVLPLASIGARLCAMAGASAAATCRE